jgi:predicted nucleic acid-binding protein
MKQVFADTSYWIALLNPRDELHQKAIAAAQDYPAEQIVTSEMVLVELLNGFSDHGPRVREAVSRAVQTLRSNPGVRVVPQTSDQFDRALTRYRSVVDKNWSLTDCASFLIMEAEGIEAALTHERHFAQAGFQTLLR